MPQLPGFLLSNLCAGLMALLLGGLIPTATAQPALVGSPRRYTDFIDAANLRSAVLFDVAFETNGTAWIAASDGLHRYDGYEWRLFGTNQGLPSTYVRTVAMDGAGHLWVGTDRGAGVFDGERFELFAPPHRLAGPSVRRIRHQTDGSVWFCSDRWPDPTCSAGLTVLKGGQWRTFRETNGLPSDHVYNFYRDAKGREFALTEKGVAQFDRGNWRTVIQEPVWDLVETTNGIVIGFSGERAYYLQDDTWHSNSYPRVPRSGHPPKSLFANARGQVLAYGLGLWTGHGFDAFGPLSVSDVVPEAIREAPDGSLWCVDSAMLVRWDPTPRSWMEFTNLPPPRFVLPSGQVLFVSAYAATRWDGTNFVSVPGLANDPQRMEMDAEGAVWSWSAQEIRRWTGETRAFTAGEAGLTEVLGGVRDGTGRIWFYGAGANGAVRTAFFDGERWLGKDGRAGRFRPILEAVGDPETGVWFSTQDSAGRGWFVHTDGTNFSQIGWPAEALRRGAARLLVDRQRNRWAYGDWGLAMTPNIRPPKWTTIEPLKATMVLEGVRGSEAAWFVFSGVQGGRSGLGCYREGRWTQVDAQIPLLMERAGQGSRPAFVGAYASPDGTLCFGGYNSLELVPNGDPAELRRLTLPEGRSIPSHILVDRSHVVWMQAQRSDGADGVLAFRTDGLSPRAVLTVAPKQVSYHGVWPVRARGVERFEVEPGRRSFTFSWRFDEAPWTSFAPLPAEGLSTASLKPGQHRFQIRARDEGLDAQLEPTEATLLVLGPPLQTQRWFQVAVWLAASTILALTLLTFRHAQQLARANTALNVEVRERRQAELDLQKAQAELRRANEELERRVETRTAELARANDSLREEMAERRRVEEAQRLLEARMLQTQKLESLGVMAGGIAHDFNNLLTTIMGNADLAQLEVPPSSTASESLQEIITTAGRAGDLCRQMLAYSGRGRFIVGPIQLSDLVRETAKMLQVSIPKNARLQMSLASDLPPVTADATQIRQVIMNLVINGAEALDNRQGTIVIATRLQDCSSAFFTTAFGADSLAPGKYVVLEVQDNGCGMDAATRERMFDPFFTTKFTGRGLGLAAVLGIVRGHRGAVKVVSTVGQGTTFTVLLPPSDRGEEPMAGARASAAPPRVDTPQGLILLVDDEDGVREVAGRMLRRLGYSVLEAKSGPEALELAARETREVALALLDLTMPQMNGVDTFLALRRSRPDLRAVLASGYTEVEVEQRFAGSGIAGFLQKPYTIEGLHRALAIPTRPA